MNRTSLGVMDIWADKFRRLRLEYLAIFCKQLAQLRFINNRSFALFVFTFCTREIISARPSLGTSNLINRLRNLCL